MANSTTPSVVRKTGKAAPKFPLWIHKGNEKTPARWCKKIRGTMHYFGNVADDPDGEAALKKWTEQADDLRAGRKPRPTDDDGATVGKICNRFLLAKQQQVDAGELKRLSWLDYKRTCDRLVDKLGAKRLVSDLRSEDFEALKASISATNGPVSTGNEVQRVRVVFRYAYEAGVIDVPVRFGPLFKRPSKQRLRIEQAKRGTKLIEAADLRRIIEAADVHLKAMVYLALNGGLGNSDVGNLPLAALDLDGGWCDYPRPKTGVQRRFPLWPETVKALRASLAKRPTPRTPEAERLFFVTKYGAPWAKELFDNPVTKEFRKLLESLGLHRERIGFYTLRHVFRTVADGAGDQPATNHVMGHSDGSMGENYTHRIDDARLLAVVNHVRKWLNAKPKAAKKTSLKICG